MNVTFNGCPESTIRFIISLSGLQDKTQPVAINFVGLSFFI